MRCRSAAARSSRCVSSASGRSSSACSPKGLRSTMRRCPPWPRPSLRRPGSSDSPGRIGELESFALETLPAMQLDDASFCFEVVRGEPEPRGRSLRYTLIVLVGLLRAEAAGRAHSLDTVGIKSLVVDEGHGGNLSPGDFGLLLWADARSGGEATRVALDGLERSLERAGGFEAIIGMDLGLAANGLLAAQAEQPMPRAEPLIEAALGELIARNRWASGLLSHVGRGWRRRFPNFATQIYGVLAL